MSIDDKSRERKFHLWGGILVVVCGGFFIASAAEANNILGLAGSIIFLVACLVFIVPLLIRRNQDEDS